MYFCRGCLIQNGRLTAIYGRNLFWAITWYWIEILHSNLVCWHFKIKTWLFVQVVDSNRPPPPLPTPKIYGRLTAIYGRNLFLAITLYWIEILTSNFVHWYLKIKPYNFWSSSSNSRWPTDRHIWSKPILGHNSVLDWDIDFKFCVLVP